MTRCGAGIDESRTCQCDTECVSRGDCCEDHSYLCWQNGRIFYNNLITNTETYRAGSKALEY